MCFRHLPLIKLSIKMTSKNNFDHNYTALRIMIRFFQIFGVAPYVPKKIITSKQARKGSWQNLRSINFTSSRLCAFYNIFLVIVLITIFCIIGPTSIHYNYPGKSDVTKTFEDFGGILGNSGMIIVWIIQAFRHKKIATLLNRLVNVDDVLKGHINDELKESFSLYCCAVIFITVGVYVAYFATDQQCYQTEVHQYLLLALPDLVLSMFMIHCAITIKSIENRFRMINRLLRFHDNRSVSDFEKRLFFAREGFLTPTIRPDVVNLKRAHANLYGIAGEFGEIHSISILFTVAYKCYLLIYSSYYLILLLLENDGDSNWIFTANSVLCVTAEVVPIIAVTTNISSIISEVRECDFILFFL